MSMERTILVLAFVNLLLILWFFRSVSLVKGISKKMLFMVIVLCIANAVLILVFFPLVHRFFVDESFYVNAARDFNYEYHKQVGWPVLLSLFFKGHLSAIYFFTLVSREISPVLSPCTRSEDLL